MVLSDLKVYSLNVVSLMVSFSDAQDTLKIILLLFSIGYTAQRWYLMNKDNKIDE